jgi:AraC family L-rhamnose operon transcriptional activator RhaR/AraC family L-rhamnose operon regulatory protein RhaS
MSKSLYIAKYQLPLWIVLPGKQIKNLFHDHEFSEIAIVTRGEALHLGSRQKEKISVGDVLLLHPGSIHAFDYTKDFSLVNIIYDAQKIPIPILDGYDLSLLELILMHKPKDINTGVTPVTKLDDKTLQKVIKLVNELDSELKSCKAGCQFLSMALFMEIIICIARRAQIMTVQHDKLFLVGDAINYINEHYREKITLSDIAKKAKMSKRSLSRHFKNACGLSPISYVNHIRLNCAAELLMTTNRGIDEISMECGFKEINYFIRVFKDRFKQTPHRFRKSHR